MKEDMRIMNPLNTEKRIPDRKESDYSMRKSRVNNNAKDSSRLDNAHPEDAKGTSFKETYDTVSKAKSGTRKSAEKTQGISRNANTEKCRNGKQRTDETIKCENVIANETAQMKAADDSKKSPETAIAIIQESLNVISEKLHLNIELANGLGDLDLEDPSDAVLEQFSEILFALKSISHLLEKAVGENVALDVNGRIIEPQEAAEIEQTLRMEIFRLEIAFEALGIAGDVSRAVAGKMNIPLMDGGVPQATDPINLFMPENQLKQILTNLMKTSEDQIKSVVSRIVALANEQGSGTYTVDQTKEQDLGTRISALLKEQNPDGNKNVSINVADVKVEKHIDTGKSVELCSIDPQVMRRLLKIDGHNLSGEGNAEGKEGKAPVFTLPASSTLTSNQNFQQLFTMIHDPGEQVSEMDTSIRSEGQPVDMSAKLPTMPFKNIEDSVIFQVTQKLANAVKSGIYEIRLILKPESLGDIRMTIQMDGDIVMARINVENQHVKQIIESNLQNLKNSLEEHNLHAGAFDVNVNKGFDNGEQDPAKPDKDVNIAGDTTGAGEGFFTGSVTVGTETGRRFGNNTIEYFA